MKSMVFAGWSRVNDSLRLSLLIGLSACVASVQTTFAKTTTFIGRADAEDGDKFSIAANWDNGLPVETDTLYVSSVVERVENDLAGDFKIKELNLYKNANVGFAPKLYGNRLKVTSRIRLYGGSELHIDIDASANDLYLQGGGDSKSYGTITVGTPAVNKICRQYVDSGQYLELYGPLIVNGTFTNNGNETYHNGSIKFYSTGNYFTKSSPWQGSVYFYEDDAVDPEFVIGFGDTSPVANRGVYYFNGTCQTANRIIGTVTRTAGCQIDGTGVLTLNGTESAVSPCLIQNSLSVVWNPTGPHTQAFTNRAHTTTGSLTVRHGMMAMVGTCTFAKVPEIVVEESAAFEDNSTSAGSLKALKTLTLGKSATFSIAETATTPIDGLDMVRLEQGALIKIPANCTLTAVRLSIDGTYPPSATYTGVAGVEGTVKADWIEGEGRVVVENANITSWKAPVSGNWGDEKNWTRGVPAADSVAKIEVLGASYTVEMDSSVVWPVDLALGSGSATLRAGSGVNLVLDGGTRTTAAVSISNGARFLVDGGAVAFTNWVGTFSVEGSAFATSRVDVAGGCFLYGKASGSAAQSRMSLGVGSEVRIGAGEFVNLSCGADSVNFAGGKVLCSGTGKYRIVKGPGATDQDVFNLNDGELVLDGESEFVRYGSIYAVMNPAAGKTARLAFKGHAANGSGGNNFCMGWNSTGKGSSRLDLDSDATHASFGYNMLVGCGFGSAEMNMSAGYLTIGNRGLEIASDRLSQEGEVTGVFNLSGGGLAYTQSDLTGWCAGRPLGFLVGYGGMTTRTEGQHYIGSFNMTGGAFTNSYGHTMVGLGFARGAWLQTGGSYVNLKAGDGYGRGMIGGFGGEGLLEMRGGLFSHASDMYVGGAGTDVIVKGNSCVEKGLPSDRHDATGLLRFSGGTMVFERNLVLGADGRGTLERIGTAGSLTVGGDLILSNSVANANSGGTLRFVFDANGVSPVVAKNVQIQSGAKLEIDLADYDGEKNVKVLTAQSVTGAFAPSAISVTGVKAKDAKVTVTDTYVKVGFAKGLMILFR